MSGPWYEEQGPDAEYVRNHQLGIWKLKVGSNQLCESTIDLIKHVLLIHIPDSTPPNSFGSYRGYATFGLEITTKNNIEKTLIFKLHARTKAMNKLRYHFLPLVMHYLYKPGGIRFSNIKKTTNVGKKNY